MELNQNIEKQVWNVSNNIQRDTFVGSMVAKDGCFRALAASSN